MGGYALRSSGQVEPNLAARPGSQRRIRVGNVCLLAHGFKARQMWRMIPLSPVDELLRQACTVLARQWYGEAATVKLIPSPPTYDARVVIGATAADPHPDPAPETATGSTPREALDRLLARLQRTNGVDLG